MFGRRHVLNEIKLRKNFSFFIFYCFFLFLPAWANSEFNLQYLHGAVSEEDVSLLNFSGAVLPGEYKFSVFLNGKELQQEQIIFKKIPSGRVEPCINRIQLAQWGIDVPASEHEPNEECVDVATLIAGSDVQFNGNQQRLDLRIPQIFLKKLPNGYIPKSFRNQGVNAVFLNYGINGLSNEIKGVGLSNYYFGSLKTGVNFNAWRLRYNSSLSASYPHGEFNWGNKNISLERDIEKWRGRLVLGDTYTTNTVFDSFGFRGILISSDEEMLPYSQRSYAPIVRGLATSSARVEVRQDGVLIYAMNVAPGPFSIDDIVPNRLSGELDIKVIEADGQVQNYQQAFSSAEKMLRPGLWRYELSAGRIRNQLEEKQPFFIEGSLYHGLINNLTPYIGLLVSNKYSAFSLGAAKSFGDWGVLSLDMTSAQTQWEDGQRSVGHQYKFSYSKTIDRMGTSVRLTGQSLSGPGYYSFNDANVADGIGNNFLNCDDNFSKSQNYASEYSVCHAYSNTMQGGGSSYSPKNQINLSVNQIISEKMFVYLNFSRQNFFKNISSDKSIQFGLNGLYKNLSYGIFYFDTLAGGVYKDKVIGLSVSIPLGKTSKSNNNINSSFSYSQQQGASYRSGVNGSVQGHEQWSYAMDAGRSDASGGVASAGVTYQGSQGVVTMGIETGSDYRQMNWGARGALLLHGGGINFTQEIDGATALIYAPGATGVGVENHYGLKVNSNSFAVVSGLTPYKFNRVALRADNYFGDVDLSKAITNVVPTRGAMVKVNFDTRVGKSFLIRSWRRNQTVIPLGANVYGEDGLPRGLVGLNGEIFVSAVAPQENISVVWDEGEDGQCLITLPNFENQENVGRVGYQRLELPCL